MAEKEKKQFQISDDYVEVAQRVVDLYEKHPNAVLEGEWIVQAFGATAYIVYTARCWRDPDDPRPCVGIAMEEIPGKTPYTKGSEIQNAETSAWGRAIIAAGASQSKRIASADEIRSANARRDTEARASEELAPKPWRDRITAALNAIEPKTKRAAVKHNFAENFGEPNTLTVSQIKTVEDVLKNNEIAIPDEVPDPAASTSDASSEASRAPVNPPAQADGSGAGDTSGSGAGAGDGSGVVAPPAHPAPAETGAPARAATAQQKRTLGIRFAELVKNEHIGPGAKDEIVAALTLGRTTSRTEITQDEASKLLALTHAIEAGSVSVNAAGGELPLLTPNNAQGDVFLQKWPKPAEVAQ